MYGLIYKATNVENRKVYIGQTIEFKKRKRSHIFNAIKKRVKGYFPSAIRKYGSDKFKWEILGYCTSKEELNDAEIICIEFFNSINPIYGYNMTPGGDGGGCPHTEEEKQKISRANKGKKRSEETMQKIREINKIINKNKGRNNSRYILVDDSVIDKIIYLYEIRKMSKIEIAEELGFSEKKIYNLFKEYNLKSRKTSTVMKGKTHIERFGTKKAKETSIRMSESRKGKIGKKIINIDTGQTFPSAREACRYYNLSKTAITHVLKGINKTSAGYRWDYYNE